VKKVVWTKLVRHLKSLNILKRHKKIMMLEEGDCEPNLKPKSWCEKMSESYRLPRKNEDNVLPLGNSAGEQMPVSIDIRKAERERLKRRNLSAYLLAKKIYGQSFG